MQVESALLDTIDKSTKELPADYVHQQGWVMIAFKNSLCQLLHAPGLEEGVVDTITRGGDTDTNAAICGALCVVGKLFRPGGSPACKTAAQIGHPRVRHPRPEYFWSVDALELAEGLIKT